MWCFPLLLALFIRYKHALALCTGTSNTVIVIVQLQGTTTGYCMFHLFCKIRHFWYRYVGCFNHLTVFKGNLMIKQVLSRVQIFKLRPQICLYRYLYKDSYSVFSPPSAKKSNLYVINRRTNFMIFQGLVCFLSYFDIYLFYWTWELCSAGYPWQHWLEFEYINRVYIHGDAIWSSLVWTLPPPLLLLQVKCTCIFLKLFCSLYIIYLYLSIIFSCSVDQNVLTWYVNNQGCVIEIWYACLLHIYIIPIHSCFIE